MRPIRVSKTALIAKLEENRAEHRKIFEEAVIGYRDEAIRQLDEHIKRIKANKKIVRVSVYVTPPEDHTKDYDAALELLAMSVDDVIDLDEETFRNYVRDEWSWSRSFLSTNSAYSMSASVKWSKEEDD